VSLRVGADDAFAVAAAESCCDVIARTIIRELTQVFRLTYLEPY
jgi:hypothetical protein